MVNPTAFSSVASIQSTSVIPQGVPSITEGIRPVGEQLSSVLQPGVQISERIQASKEAASAHTGLINDALTRLGSGGSRFRSGLQVAATTTHYSSAQAHGVTDPGQDLGTGGGPIQLVEDVLAQMAQLGGRAVGSQASHLPGM